MAEPRLIHQAQTEFGTYQIIDAPYDGRPARVLYSGNRQAAQSGIAQDDEPELLFDYNQRFFELAISLVPRRVLIIGGGVYTLAAALLTALPDTIIDVVEPDRGLHELAVKYFGLPESDRLHSFYADGRSYLAQATKQYDMIFVDAYVHTTIPRSLTTLEAVTAYRQHTIVGGVVAMNVISSYHGGNAELIRSLYAAFCAECTTVDIFYASRGYSLWLPQNFVLTGQAGTTLPLRDYVRHEAVQPPEVLLDEARKD